MAARDPQQIFDHHAQALGGEDLEGIISDYADDALVICQGTVYPGTDGVRQVFTQLLRDVPQASWELPTTVYADDVLYLEWRARSAKAKVDDGIDTFVFRDGRIQLQTVRYTLQATG